MPATPARIDDVDHLETLLSEPTPHALETMARLDGDLLLLGVAGKMGPTLARMARHAADETGTHDGASSASPASPTRTSNGNCKSMASRRSAATCLTKTSSRGCRRRRT